MAKKKPAGKLAGKSVAFAGKFGYDVVDQLKRLATAEGAAIAAVATGAPDIVVEGQGIPRLADGRPAR